MLPGLRINRRVNGRGTGGQSRGRDRAPAYVGGRGHRNSQSLPLRQVASPPSSPPTPTQQVQVPQQSLPWEQYIAIAIIAIYWY